jgi:hypothetical protein
LKGLAILTAFLLVRAKGAYAAEPLLVVQPSYIGMQFYVSQPQGLPPNWYTTFDGYPVWRNAEGVWLYGSFSGAELIPTNYVVGSVIPSVAGLAPFVVAQAAPAQQAQQIHVQAAAVAAPQQTAVAAQSLQTTPAALQTVVVAAPAPVMAVPAYPAPGWALNPHFMALGEWRGNVDRVGVLHKPPLPVAWKGNSPKVIYAWTGTTWYQMVARDGERPGEVLRNNLYTLVRFTHQNRVWWHDPDVTFLAHQSAQWGYFWMGEIGPVLPPLF